MLFGEPSKLTPLVTKECLGEDVESDLVTVLSCCFGQSAGIARGQGLRPVDPVGLAKALAQR
jgi:hypothetical protein